MPETEEEKYVIKKWATVRAWDNRKGYKSESLLSGKIIRKAISKTDKGIFLLLNLDTGFTISIGLPKDIVNEERREE